MFLRSIAAVVLTCLLAACKAGPNFVTPHEPTPPAYAGAADEAAGTEAAHACRADGVTLLSVGQDEADARLDRLDGDPHPGARPTAV